MRLAVSKRSRSSQRTGSQRIVEGADVGHRGERRAQHQRRGRCSAASRVATPLPSDSPKYTRRVAAASGRARRKARAARASAASPASRRRAGIPAVAAVVEEQDTVSALAQRRGQGRAEPAMPGVAVEDEDGGGGARLERRHQPAVQPEAVCRGKHHGFGRREPDEHGERARRRRGSRSGGAGRSRAPQSAGSPAPRRSSAHPSVGSQHSIGDCRPSSGVTPDDDLREPVSCWSP